MKQAAKERGTRARAQMTRKSRNIEASTVMPLRISYTRANNVADSNMETMESQRWGEKRERELHRAIQISGGLFSIAEGNKFPANPFESSHAIPFAPLALYRKRK